MPLIAHVILRGVSKEQYDQVREAAGWLERPPEGGLAHLIWWEGDDCHNIDAWQSEEAFNAFGNERLGPALASVGVNVQPDVTFHQAHEVFTPGELRMT